MTFWNFRTVPQIEDLRPGLRWKDVDLKAGIIYVRYSMEFDRGEKVHKLKDYLTTAFGRHAKKCHFPITFYDLRHTHTTILAEMVVPIGAVAERLGNESSCGYGTYSHVTQGMQRDIVLKLEKLFDKTE